ncbi:MAG: hypothetical protein ACYTGR_18310 [Planctomycetota bacterium]
MTRPTMIVGLLVSAVLHAILLAIPASPAPPSAPATPHALPVEIVETGPPQSPPEEEPDDVSEPAPVPQPEPEPKPKPEPAQQPAPPKPVPPNIDPSNVAQAEPETAPSSPEPTRPDLAALLERARAALPAGGDVSGAAGEPTAPRPELRIDWGDAAHTLDVLDAGDMRVVVVRGPASAVVIDDEVMPVNGTWTRRAYAAPITRRFSNRLRIVDDVPAFGAARRGARLAADEHLAVLVPDRVERLLHSAELRAAIESGLEPRHIRSVGGQFVLVDGALVFETHSVQPRAGLHQMRDQS